MTVTGTVGVTVRVSTAGGAGRRNAVGEVRNEGALPIRLMCGHRRLLMHDLQKVITHVHLVLTGPL